MLIGKLLAVLVFGAILAMPVHVMAGTMLAPWKIRERWVLIFSTVFAYAVVVALVFGAT